MKKMDIDFKCEDVNARFNFRVAALFVNKDKILLQKTEHKDYYALIGGRVHLGESTKDAIKREIKEEVGVKVSDKDLMLIKIVENFYTNNNIKVHEILYIYKVTNKKVNKMNDFKTLDKENAINSWHDIKDIKKINVRPRIIKTCYKDKKLSTDLIVK